MKHQRKSPAAVKVIACLLLLGSLACFMLPWLKLSADTGPDRLRMSPGELLQNTWDWTPPPSRPWSGMSWQPRESS